MKCSIKVQLFRSLSNRHTYKQIKKYIVFLCFTYIEYTRRIDIFYIICPAGEFLVFNENENNFFETKPRLNS